MRKKLHYYLRRFTIGLCLFTACLLLHALITPAHAKTTDILQFTSEGHVLGFAPGSMYLATGTHALKAEFVGGKATSPQAQGGASPEGKAPPLSRVTYSNVWDGVDVSYGKDSDTILKSTYTISPGKSRASIRVRYNHPLSIDESGNLVVRYETGRMTEGRPHAWQMIDGKKKPVMVAYTQLSATDVGFAVGNYVKDLPLVVEYQVIWNNFVGAAGDWDYGGGIAVDSKGDVYVAGQSDMSWGTPVRPWHRDPSGYNWDGWVAKLSGADGTLLWNTFLGGSDTDNAIGIAVDSSGNVYAAGYSYGTWGNPVNAHTGSYDGWVAKLNPSNGVLIWNTFFGGTGEDYLTNMAVDSAGNAYTMGYSYSSTWGTPVRPSPGFMSPWVAKIDTAGKFLWNTFLGGSMWDSGYGLASDSAGNVYATGMSMGAWGAPLKPYGGGDTDAFVAKLDTSGNLLWNTFLGGSGYGNAIALDSAGSIYVLGYSDDTWGTPVRASSGGGDAFLAKLDASGSSLLWNTFLGGASLDYSTGMALDSTGIYATGYSYATWGAPANAFIGNVNMFLAGVNPADGTLLWNTFFGGDGDYPYGIAVDSRGAIYATGTSLSTWGTPVSPKPSDGGNSDVFVARLSSRHTLTVSKSGTGTGSVVSSPSGIDCGSVCSGDFSIGASVTLTATPDAGSTLTGLTGCDSISGSACIIKMTSDRNVTARFSSSCTYSINPTQKTFTADGGTVSVAVQATGQNCVSPAVSSDSPWIGVKVTSFSNSKGTVEITASGNNTASTRTGTVSIWKNAFLVTQNPCSVAISPTSATLNSSGGSGVFTVTAPAGCAWSAQVDSSWLSATPSTGSGNGAVSYKVSKNTSGAQRNGKITVSSTANPSSSAVFTVTEKK